MKILFTDKNGSLSIVVPSQSYLNLLMRDEKYNLTKEEAMEFIIRKDVPTGSKNVRIIKDNEIPSDGLFRNAWEDTGKAVKVNIEKAREISHHLRRESRRTEFKPYDDVISKQIPGVGTGGAEKARVIIRKKYDKMQDNIDNAKDDVALRTVLKKGGVI